MGEEANSSEAVCSLCSTSFCAACDLPPHIPATCDMVAAWEAKGGYLETGQEEDAEARKLKHLTTKPCPRCGVRIEKNGGCPVGFSFYIISFSDTLISLLITLCFRLYQQHMTCIRQNCKYQVRLIGFSEYFPSNIFHLMQFCWECSGEFHTSTQCTRPKVNIDNNSILLFDEFDRQCANHFLARQVALQGKSNIQTYLLHCNSKSSSTEFDQAKFNTFSKNQASYGSNPGNGSIGDLVYVCNVIKEGWTLLAEAQSVLAHCCIVMFTVKSAKLQFIFDQLKQKTLVLQQNFEEEWIDVGTFPVDDAKISIAELRMRLRSFIVEVQSEIIVAQSASATTGAKSFSSRGNQGVPALGNPTSNHDSGRSLNTKVMVDIPRTAFGHAFGGSGKIYRIVEHA